MIMNSYRFFSKKEDGRFLKIQKFIYVCSLCVICGYPYIKAYIICMHGQRDDKGNKFIKKFGIS